MHRLAIAIACAATLVVGPDARAGWTPDGVTLYGDPHGAFWMRLAPDGGGGTLVWWGAYAGGPGNILRSARVSPDGTPYANWDEVNPPFVPTGQVSVTPDGLGGLFRVWVQSSSVATQYDLYLDHMGPTGASDPASYQEYVATTTDLEWYPGIAGDGSGGVYIAYLTSFSQVRLKRIQADGSFAPGWPPAGVRLSDDYDGAIMPISPIAQPDGGGGVVVAWVSESGARAQHITSAGARATGTWADGSLPLNSNPGANTSALFALAPSGSDAFDLCWTDGSSTGARGIWVQRFGGDGLLAAGWPTDGVHITSPGSALDSPAAVVDGSGAATMAWWDGVTFRGIRVQSDATIASGWPSAGISLLDAGAVPYGGGVIASGNAGGVIVLWPDSRDPGTVGARARWLLADGSPDPTQPDTGRVLLPGNAYSAPMAAMGDGSGGAYVGWERSVVQGLWSYIGMSWVPYPSALAVPPSERRAMLSLAAPWPNPARGALNVRFSLRDDSPARLELMDVAGRRVRSIDVSGAGEHVQRFDRLERLPAGVYLVRVRQAADSRTARATIVR